MRSRIVILVLLVTAIAAIQTLPLNSPTLESSPNLIVLEIGDKNLEIQVIQTSMGLELLLDTPPSVSLSLDMEKLQERVYQVHGEHFVRLRVLGLTSPIENTTFTTPVLVEDSPNAIIQNNTIKDNTSSTFNYAIFLDNCPNSLIANNTVLNIVSTGASVVAIQLEGSSGTTIEDNRIVGISSTSTSFLGTRDVYGIIVNSSQDVKILNTSIDNLDSNAYGYGVFVDSSSNVNVNDSFINDIESKSSHGIYVNNSGYIVIKNTTITNIGPSDVKSSAISLYSSSNSTILLNNVTTLNSSSAAGGIYLSASPNTTVGNNTVSSFTTTSIFSPLVGISLQKSNSTTVEWNNITDLTSGFSESKGISVEDSAGSIVSNNRITNVLSEKKPAYGIILSSSDSMTVSENIIDQIEGTSSVLQRFQEKLVGEQEKVFHSTAASSASSYGIFLINCESVSINGNNFSSTTFWMYTDETSSSLTYSNNNVDGNAVGFVSFIRPANLRFEEGTTGQGIVWDATDSLAASYRIFKDGAEIDNGTWVSGVYIIHPVSNLALGSYTYMIILTEQNGVNITDEVTVNVIESDSPVLEDSPDDVRYLVDTLGHYIVWVVDDSHPSTYAVYRNGTEVNYGSWTANTSINISVNGLPLGMYNYTLKAEDTSGNAAQDTVLVYVLEATHITLETIMSDPLPYEYGSTGNVLNWTVNSIFGGTYDIYKDGEKQTAGAFEPGEPISYPLPTLTVGNYNYSITVKDTTGNSATDFIIVNVVANPTLTGVGITNATTLPTFTNPPYLSTPPGPLPLFEIALVASVLVGLPTASFWYTRRRMVPQSVKSELDALKKARKLKDKRKEGQQLSKMAHTYAEMGDIDKAIENHEEALKVFEKIGDKSAQQRELGSLGDAYFKKGSKSDE